MLRLPKWVWALLAIIVISSATIYVLMMEHGEFVKSSHTTFKEESLKDIPDVYMGHRMKWDGRGNPTLTSMQLIRETDRFLITVNRLKSNCSLRTGTLWSLQCRICHHRGSN